MSTFRRGLGKGMHLKAKDLHPTLLVPYKVIYDDWYREVSMWSKIWKVLKPILVVIWPVVVTMVNQGLAK